MEIHDDDDECGELGIRRQKCQITIQELRIRGRESRIESRKARIVSRIVRIESRIVRIESWNVRIESWNLQNTGRKSPIPNCSIFNEIYTIFVSIQSFFWILRTWNQLRFDLIFIEFSRMHSHGSSRGHVFDNFISKMSLNFDFTSNTQICISFDMFWSWKKPTTTFTITNRR